MNTHVILLAAGRGTRLKSYFDGPKPLIPFGKEPLLHRTLRQLHEVGLHDITILTGDQSEEVASCARSCFPNVTILKNDRYEEDRNIYSTLIGLQSTPEDAPVAIIEGDIAFSDKGILRIREMASQTKSTWAACGKFQPDQVGGIIKSADSGLVERIIYSDYAPEYASWLKNLGILFVASKQKKQYAALLKSYADASLDHYYMTPWAEHLDQCPSYVMDIGRDGGMSFNTEQEYRKAMECVLPPASPGQGPAFKLVDVDRLNHIEDFDPARAEWLADKIRREGVWTRPLALSNRHHLVMDGQHRMEAAKIMGLNKVPAVFFDYDNVQVYSLRPDECTVSKECIESQYRQGRIYPYKTAKHIFPHACIECEIPLSELA